MRKKLIKFEQKSGYYLNKGSMYAEKGEWLKALSSFFAAQERDEGNIDIAFRIARVYYEIGLYEFSNSALFEVLQADPYNAEAGLMIAKNFAAMGDVFREIYYLGRYSAVGPEGFADWLGDRMTPAFEQVHPMTEKERELNKHRVNRLMDHGMTEDARALLAEILEYFPDDAFSKNNLSKAYLLEEKPKEAMEWAQSALEDNPGDVFARCNLSILLFMTGRTDKAGEIADSLALTETDDIEDIKRLAKFFCFFGRHKDVAHWCRLLLDQTPYDTDYLIFLAIAYYNLREYELSKDIFLTLNMLRVSPLVVKHYLDLIESTGKKGASEEIPYEFELPEKLEKIYFRKLKTMDFAAEKDEFSNNLISWGLRYADEELTADILDRLIKADEKTWEADFERMLASDLPPKTKSLVLFRLYKGKRRNLFLIKDDYFSEAVWPNRMPPENVRNGFLLAAAVLNCFMMEAGDIILKMYPAACDLSERLASHDFLTGHNHDGLIAAVIVRNAGKELCGDKVLCELFNVDYNVLSFFTGQVYG